MFGIGTTELLVVLGIVIVIFGARRLPELGSGLGKAIKNFKAGVSEKGEIDVTPIRTRSRTGTRTRTAEKSEPSRRVSAAGPSGRSPGVRSGPQIEVGRSPRPRKKSSAPHCSDSAGATCLEDVDFTGAGLAQDALGNGGGQRDRGPIDLPALRVDQPNPESLLRSPTGTRRAAHRPETT